MVQCKTCGHDTLHAEEAVERWLREKTFDTDVREATFRGVYLSDMKVEMLVRLVIWIQIIEDRGSGFEPFVKFPSQVDDKNG